MFKPSGIGPTLMTIVWLFYVLVLIFEGRLFKALFKGEAQQDTAKVFYRLSVFHWVILGLSLTLWHMALSFSRVRRSRLSS